MRLRVALMSYKTSLAGMSGSRFTVSYERAIAYSVKAISYESRRNGGGQAAKGHPQVRARLRDCLLALQSAENKFATGLRKQEELRPAPVNEDAGQVAAFRAEGGH
jgi:hypothetical protein